MSIDEGNGRPGFGGPAKRRFNVNVSMLEISPGPDRHLHGKREVMAWSLGPGRDPALGR
jgi:hypothetical protein